jgi:hypothetical protein
MDVDDRERRERRVPLHLRIDVLGGLFLCATAAAIWLGATPLTVGELRYFGPGFLPRVLAAGLLAGGLALLIRGVTQPDAAAERLALEGRGPLLVSLGILLFALTVKGFSIGPLAVPELGLLVAGPLTVLVVGLGSAEAKPRELIVLGLGLSALMTLVFVDLLDVQLPVFPAVVASSIPLEWGPSRPRQAAVVLWLAVAWGLWWAFGLSLADLKERHMGDGA